MAQRDLTTSGPPIPRFTLKSVKIYERMSEETTAFDANVYLDGKRIGYAKNDGCGGSTMVMVEPAHRARVEPLFVEVANAIAPIVVDGKTRCCSAGVARKYETLDVCERCDRMIHIPGEPFLDGAAAYVADALVERGKRVGLTHACARADAFAFLTRQIARIDTVAVGPRVELHMSDGRTRLADRDYGALGFVDLDPKLSVYIHVDVAARRATVGMLFRADGSVCGEKWVAPVELERMPGSE